VNYEIKDWKEDKRNTLLGFATVVFVGLNLEIRGCTFHEKGGRRWISLPAKPYTKADGTTGWNYIIAFTDTFAFNRFQEDILKIFNKLIFKVPKAPKTIYLGGKPPWIDDPEWDEYNRKCRQ